MTGLDAAAPVDPSQEYHSRAFGSKLPEPLRPLARGVTMRGAVTSLVPVSAVPHEQGITVRVVAMGTAVVEVR